MRSKIALLVLAAIFLASPRPAHVQNATKANNREEAYRANNIGVALLEQFKAKEAADAFRRALQLDPALALARINLGIALFNIPDVPAAQKELQAAIAAAPNAPQPHYVLGLAAKSQNKADEAIASFQKVLQIDAQDVGANVNLGQLYAQQRKYAEAIAVLRTAGTMEPYNATALYNLGTSLIRSGQRDEGQKVVAQFQELRNRGTGTTLGNNYLEQGRYAEAIASTGAEADVVDKETPEVVFTDVTSAVLPPPPPGWQGATTIDLHTGSLLLFDYDLDGDLDLLEVSDYGQRLLRNDKGKFTDVTAQAGALSKGAKSQGAAAIAGDYDNDTKPDLFIIRMHGGTLYHNDGNGSFSDVTATAKIPATFVNGTTAAFVDFDHDGDLDLLLGGDGLMLLRNNGDGTFADQTEAAKLTDKVHARAIVPTDFDNRRDIDLLVASSDKTSLWRNLRDGTFRDVAAEVGLTLKGAINVTAGDVNKDGFTDFYFASPDAGTVGYLALSDGKEHFRITQAGGAASASQFLDYDNDGLLDLVSVARNGLSVLRNTGNTWTDVSAKATKGLTAGGLPYMLVAGDIDGDGDTDIIYGAPGNYVKVARNDGGNTNRSLRVNLAGRVSNRSGVGAKIEVRAGSLAQKLETYSASPAPAPGDIVFGLGKRTAVDAVRVLWPAGIVQAETEIANTNTLSLTELDRKPSSCPYLYVWNGERFQFVTDFMGGGEMGHLDAPRTFNTPDPDEYVRIPRDLLRERNGRYELRVTNELEEALFVDHVQLIAVAHPEGVEVYPNEGLTEPPQPFKIYSTRDARPPVSAVDEHGHDVLARIARLDREYPDDFPLLPIRGYAKDHELTLNPGPTTSSHTRLLLTGWTDYAWSSDNLAASQSGKSLTLPALQVKDKEGRWRTVIENVGIPVGRPQTVVADLSGKFLSASREVRIVTNMRIYWDQILVDTSSGNFPMQLTRLDPVVADLRWRGFSLEHSPDGRQPLGYDYDKVSFTSPWKVMTGRYTREGDVRELLLTSDDMFVISRPGDELSLSFPADKLPPLPNGWTRTFLLYADGFSKEMDINSASPDQVGPLPFHGMSKYPYAWPERYPLTKERQRYLEKYNTRVVTSHVDRIAGFKMP